MPNVALLALEASDGTVVLTSITLVFAMLIALCLIITIEGKIFDSINHKPAKPQAPKPQKAAPKAPPKPWPNRPGIPPAARTLPPSSRPLLHCKLSAKTCATKTRPPCTGWIPTAMP
jgi:hypothetical protein